MNFKKATDELAGASHEDLSKLLGVSLPSIRQARLDPSAKAHRSPPEGWEAKLADFMEREAKRLQKAADALRRPIRK